MYQKFIRQFLIRAAVLLVAAAAVIIWIDPFFHYHEPVPGLKKVVTKSEYQCIGTLKNFEYDSIIAGSSVAENYNNHWFDELFGVTTVKAIKSSGTVSDLVYYLERAFEEKEIKNVFYSMDLFALDGNPEQNFLGDSMPLYLFNENPFDDVNYFWNKDVLFEDVPYMMAQSWLEDYDEGMSYNWDQYRTFGKEETLSHYNRAETVAPMRTKEQYQERVDQNVDLLVTLVQEHPETEFYFFLPPYSMLWWDNMYRTGYLEEYLYGAEVLMENLLTLPNVKLYDFQEETEIVYDLDQYMDPVHFREEINHFVAEKLAEEKDENEGGTYRVSKENMEQFLNAKKAMAEDILTVQMPLLYEEES